MILQYIQRLNVCICSSLMFKYVYICVDTVAKGKNEKESVSILLDAIVSQQLILSSSIGR